MTLADAVYPVREDLDRRNGCTGQVFVLEDPTIVTAFSFLVL